MRALQTLKSAQNLLLLSHYYCQSVAAGFYAPFAASWLVDPSCVGSLSVVNSRSGQ